MRTVTLGEVATIDRITVNPDTIDPNDRYVGLESIERGGRIIASPRAGTQALASTKFRFTSEHVLLGKLRPNLAKVARPSFSGICSTDILPIRPGEELDRGFLALQLLQPKIIDQVASLAVGANLPRISPTVLNTLRLVLPPLREQRRIAAILDQADAVRASRREILAHLDDLTQSLFHDMFGHPEATVIERFGDVVLAIQSGVSPTCEPRVAQPGEWGVLKLNAVTSGIFNGKQNKAYVGAPDRLKASQVHVGDLLMTRKNTPELVGAVAVVREVEGTVSFPDLVFRLVLDLNRLDATYLQTLMMSPAMRVKVRALSSGSALSMSNISQGRLKQLPIPIPPLPLQQEFAERVAAINAQRASVQRALAADDELFASLQARAFQGEL